MGKILPEDYQKAVELKKQFENQCSKCGGQLGNRWEYNANSFDLIIKVDCCSTQALWGNDYHEIEFNHPAIRKKSGYQELIFKSARNEPYRLCPSCNRDFIKMIGDFIRE